MEKELMELSEKQKFIIGRVAGVNIVSTETLQGAVSITADIKEAKKRVEEIRKFFVDPLNLQVKNINAKFKPYTETLDKSESGLKSKIVVYQTAQEKIRWAEEERLRKIQQKEYEKQIKKAEKKDEAPPPPPPPVKIEVEKIEGLQMRKTWVAEIEETGLIPENIIMDFLYTPEGEKSLTKHLNKLAKGGVRKIEGVRIYEKSISAISSQEDDL